MGKEIAVFEQDGWDSVVWSSEGMQEACRAASVVDKMRRA